LRSAHQNNSKHKKKKLIFSKKKLNFLKPQVAQTPFKLITIEEMKKQLNSFFQRNHVITHAELKPKLVTCISRP
jgi:hypothetical protein